jgi:hypothetical protein
VGGHHESGRERQTIGKVPVHGGAGDSQHFRDVAGRDALLPELAGFGGVGVGDLAGQPELGAVGARTFIRRRARRERSLG